ncbi:hypothetical protein [Methyloglobulus sp.]|uniref:hypothetical protein n=1 Tax=Methyloglobulus sp. TaxID=2518622 RepID=UPI00398A3FAB
MSPEVVPQSEEAFYSDIFEMFGERTCMLEQERRLLPTRDVVTKKYDAELDEPAVIA